MNLLIMLKMEDAVATHPVMIKPKIPKKVGLHEKINDVVSPE